MTAPPLRFLKTGQATTLSSGTQTVDREKSALRTELRARRHAVHSSRGAAARDILCTRFFAHLGDTLAGKTVAAYWPIRDEIDVRPVLNGLAARAAIPALPVMGDATVPLTFRRWFPGDRLIPVAFDVYEPDPALPEVVPDIVMVPLLGFDSGGNRVGYGGGYYDRTLADIRGKRHVKAIGVAYDEQECDKIPTDRGDAPLDVIITDRRAIVPGKRESTD